MGLIRFRVEDSGFRVDGFRVWSSGLKVHGLRVWGSGFRVCRVPIRFLGPFGP